MGWWEERRKKKEKNKKKELFLGRVSFVWPRGLDPVPTEKKQP